MSNLSDRFASRELVEGILARIDAIDHGVLRFMEVCGTHTMALFETGIRPLLTDRGIELLSGPGCPVCVTDQCDLDYVFAIADLPDVTLVSFGDMLRVPGSSGSLLDLREAGADVRVVYSPLDAVTIAKENPQRRIVFLAVGFETTVPGIAYTIEQAHDEKLENFFIFPLHKTIPEALAALAGNPELNLDGFLCPGHVSVVIGADAYLPIPTEHRKPCAIAGFEPVDILRGVLSLVEQVHYAKPDVANMYERVVSAQGNENALKRIDAVFMTGDARWRGIGIIPGSGLDLRDEYMRFDARLLCQDYVLPAPKPELKACRCGEILIGKITPPECECFGKSCTPEHPLGACMVSQEGACRAYYRYGGAR